jgi:mannose-6-phosphate isomerase-like protein (cupin superfamily)
MPKYRLTLAEAPVLELEGTKGIETVRMLVDGRILESKRLAMMMGYLPLGADSIIHAHPEEEIWYMLRGKGLAFVGTEEMDMEPGTCVFVPANVPHHLRNVGGEESMHICIHSPARPLPLVKK